MRKIEILTGEFYHICHRATEGIKIFTNQRDYNYLLEGLLFLNTERDLPVHWRHFLQTKKEKDLIPKNPLVEFYALILMPNHIHLLLKQLTNGGIARLMQREFTSYAKYFNTKHERKGSLFMGPYKAVHIESDNQARHIMTYIHGNALDFMEPGWRDGKIKDWIKAKTFLLNYQWSSLGFFLEQKNLNPLIAKLVRKDFGEMYHENSQDYLKTIYRWGTNDFDTTLLE